MKAQLKVRPNLIVEIDADKQVELFSELASMQEVFGEKQCGKCDNTDVGCSDEKGETQEKIQDKKTR